MQSIQIFVSGVSIALQILAGSASAGNPFGDRQYVLAAEFSGYIHFCGNSTGGEIVENQSNGTIVSTGKINKGNRWIVGNPLIDGVEENVADAEFNPNAGTGTASIVGQLVPDAIDGRWLNRQNLTMNAADGDSSTGVGIGTGELSGKIIVFETGVVETGVDSPCGPVPSVPLHGVVIELAPG